MSLHEWSDFIEDGRK
jgi:hypothetical protein